MTSHSLLQNYRLNYQPSLPLILHDLPSLTPLKRTTHCPTIDASIQELFPHTGLQPFLSFEKGQAAPTKPLKVGVVFSGGQAPGGQNVISGLFDALKKLDSSSQLIGFIDGPSGIINNKTLRLTQEVVASYRNQGGFDIIGSGRTKIETQEQFEAVEQTLRMQELDGLVIVGGDDSNTNAAFLAEFCLSRGLSTRIVGVPKTIDGDLKNDFIEISFGFDTACKIYSEMIGNLLKDSLSQKKYYFFVKLMGRSASHITLECALQTQVNLALIGEEIAYQKQTLATIASHVADLICARSEKNKHYGVVLVPEGLLEFIPECQHMIKELNQLLASDALKINELQAFDHQKLLDLVKKHLSPESIHCFLSFPEQIQKQLFLDRDPHGNVQVSKIETERLLISLIEKELNSRKQQGVYQGNFSPQPLFYGYEGRSGLPSNFDCQYCYSLGHVAALLIHQGATGYICCIKNLTQPVETWEIFGIPLLSMLHFEMRKNKKQAVIQKAFVDLEGPLFSVFKKNREKWRLEDLYRSPGPIQFEGPKELTDQPPLSLLYEKHSHS